MIAGLCSVTFRPLSVEAILDLALRAGLGAIEWSGDVHVPPHDLVRAKEVGERTRALGIQTLSYGSRYVLGTFGDFEAESLTAEALGTPYIRVWAGSKEPSEISKEEYGQLVEDTVRSAEICALRGQTLCFEYHANTCTATPEGVLRLLRDVGKDNVRTYFQAMYWAGDTALAGHAENLRAISLLRPYLTHIHVYQMDGVLRRPLEQGKTLWREYIAELGDRVYYLEFVKDGDPDRLLRDAAVLHGLLKEAQSCGDLR